jgi:ElaB/YqjD/DUF883 family membrane-anchored ribosome-binding protein
MAVFDERRQGSHNWNMETHFPFTDQSESLERRDQLLFDLKVVVRDIEELLKSTAGQLSEKASAELKSVLGRAKELCTQLEHRAALTFRQADQVIRQHPYQTIGVAFAVGALIGVLVNRR